MTKNSPHCGEDARPLPNAIIEEIERVAERVEIRFDDADPQQLPAAALAEAPIYRGGEQLQPWQRSFVTTVLQHREAYGKARLLLADEVGVGKTLSLAASALVSCLLDDGPVLILCPATLTMQWQVELADKLGIPSAVWSSTNKLWLDHRGHEIRVRGPEDIARCPSQIAIVSTGLIFHDSDERKHLLERKYGTVILDEAHRARRRGGLGKRETEPNNLLDFMLKVRHTARDTCCSAPQRPSRRTCTSSGTCCAYSIQMPSSCSAARSLGPGHALTMRCHSSKER